MRTATDPRYRKRVPCRLQVTGSAHSGMVLNVSRTGMFVQTTAGGSPGHAVHLDLSVDGSAPLPVDARVIWRRAVPPHLRTVSMGGMGVRIQYASDAYFGFVAGLASVLPAEAADASQRAAGAPSYRVRLHLAGSPRTRSLIVEAKDEREARERASRQAGAQWSVLDLEKLERED